MTVFDLLFLAGITVGALLMVAATPERYRPSVYLILLVTWGAVLLYLIGPPGFLGTKLYHWMR